MVGPEFDSNFEFATDAELAALYLRTQYELRHRVPILDHRVNEIKAIHESGLLVIAGSAPHYELELPTCAVRQVVPEAHKLLELSDEAGASITLCHSTAFYEWVGDYEPNYCPPDCSYALTKAPESGLVWSIIHIADNPNGMDSDRMDMVAQGLPPQPLTEEEYAQREAAYFKGFLLESLTGSTRLLKRDHHALSDIVEHLDEIMEQADTC